MEAISDLAMLHDLDADYSTPYVKLVRVNRSKIIRGECKQATHCQRRSS